MPTSVSGAPPIDRHAPADTTPALFGMGCFWGPDARFGALDGVVRTCVGYAGGERPNPTYAALGDHIETVRVEIDPSRLTYVGLLEHFWAHHDPTRAPFKRQYQPALFPQTDAQAEQARATYDAVAAQRDRPLATELVHDAAFHRAEAYHQKHKLRRHDAVMEAFRALYPDDAAFADAPAAALANGYIAGHRSPERLDEDAPRLGLPEAALAALRTRARQRHAS